MEKRDRKPGYFARLKRRRQLKQSPSEKSGSERGAPVIAPPDIPNDGEAEAEAGPLSHPVPPAAGGLKSSPKPAKREKRRPPGTAEFIVGPEDSLNSIALNFNVTPNKLVQLNKLFCHSVYPGQKLFVPDAGRADFNCRDASEPALADGPSAETTAEDGPKRRSARPLRRQLSPNSEDESPATVKFIKMSCKYFSDGMGVVGGVLIVTPNNIMFDPHKSDPVVIEHGCEEYGLICPMEEVLSVALYDDVSRMKLKDALPSDLPRDLCPVYRPGEREPDPERPVVLDDLRSALPETVAAEGEPTERADDRGLDRESARTAPAQDEGSSAPEPAAEEDGRSESRDALVGSRLLERIRAPIPDMLLSSEERSRTPPMFLCFKVGKPMRKSFAAGTTRGPAPSSGKKAEYWFAVPQERADHLYGFFVRCSPDVYGKEAREQGFVAVEKDELDMIDDFFGDPASCSWEIITIDEAKRRRSFGSGEGQAAACGLPPLSEASDLLQDTHVEKLACRLPARVHGYPWRLAYSTGKHGTSLKTLYRNLLDVDSPVLMVIKDVDNRIFGAFSTHPFRISEHCYGTGETFLYSFCPEIKVYRWTGENSYFVKGNVDSLQMGGGSGQLGLWLDAGLDRGTTSRCATFDNQPLSARRDFNVHSLEVWSFQ
ncbi:nuclear receptor coactivator 7 isoform X2 [Hippocampus zosterae]|uniref:nuclear receptor coactivator 7 isoform X2 n=1 Tax=Hippocampus zosterae TaxID=109293 RepID=UPI00223CFB93|nr:nuclear receptor coactivator 7 isoform X2 [Hippocampus zosterae]